MPRITYIEHNGTEHVVDVPVGTSVMRGAVNNNVPGIDADCAIVNEAPAQIVFSREIIVHAACDVLVVRVARRNDGKTCSWD